MRVTQLDAKDCHRWDAFVSREPSFSLLQSWEWGEFKKKLGWNVFRIAVEDRKGIRAGAQMLIKALPFEVFSVAYVPRGPVGDWLDEEVGPELLSALNRVAHQHRTLFLKIEPPLIVDPSTERLLRRHHFRPSSSTIQPPATLILDLSPSQDELLRRMRKKTRQYIRSATREGIQIRVGEYEDLPDFYRLLRLTSRRASFPIRSWDYYRREWQEFAGDDRYILLLAYLGDRLLAARIACRFGEHAAEFHAGSVDDFGGLHPNYLLVWEAIKWAQRHDCQTYDLWGIPAEAADLAMNGEEDPVFHRTDGLWGVYRFKSGFTKNIVNYVGAYDLVYASIPYRFITNRFVNGEVLERVARWMDMSLQGDKAFTW